MTMHPGEIIGVVMMGCIFGGWIIVSVVKTIAKNWRMAKESEHLAVIKQQMLDRGMSVDEIERVANAGRLTKTAAGE